MLAGNLRLTDLQGVKLGTGYVDGSKETKHRAEAHSEWREKTEEARERMRGDSEFPQPPKTVRSAGIFRTPKLRTPKNLTIRDHSRVCNELH